MIIEASKDLSYDAYQLLPVEEIDGMLGDLADLVHADMKKLGHTPTGFGVFTVSYRRTSERHPS